MNQIESLNNFLEILNSMEKDWDDLQDKIVKAEKEIQDLLHEIELSKFDVQRGYRLAKELQEVRQRRRAAKEQRELLQPLRDWLLGNQKQKIDLFKVLTKMKNVEQIQAARVYTPRVRQALQVMKKRVKLKGGIAMQTVVKEEYKPEVLRFRNELFENETTIEVHGQTVDRSFEDRDVYFNIDRNSGWLNGEQAIELGQALIKHGTRALIANMINHQHSNRVSKLRKFISEDRVKEVIMSVVDEHPVNYGDGFKTYLVTPVWIENMAPKYEEDFSFETVVYWSPFEEEFAKQINSWGGNVQFVGYDREKELKEFNQACKDHE